MSRVLLGLLTAVLWTCQVLAQDPTCGNFALEQIVKGAVNNQEMAIAFNRLHGLTPNARKGADDLFRVADEAQSAAIVDQLIARLGTTQVEAIFIRVEKFSEDAKRGVASAARMARYDGVNAGESVAKQMQRGDLSPEAKGMFFRDLQEISTEEGANRLLKRAAEQPPNNWGETTTVSVAAKIRRDGDRGALRNADADFGGAETGLKIDVETSTHGVQVKARAGNADLTDSHVSRSDLVALVENCRVRGITAALASNGKITGVLADWCDELEIQMWPEYVTIPLEAP